MADILVDTSVWIDFFNSAKSKEAKILQELIENEDDIYLCPVIYQEILQGIVKDAEFNEIKDILKNFNILDNDAMIVADHAVDLYRNMRKKGITVRKSADCVISSYAILGNIPIFHKDRDFTQISKYTKLRIYEHKRKSEK